MRQLALLAAFICAAASARADGPTKWFREPGDENDVDTSMTVYPLQTERKARRAAFNRFQPAPEESIPAPGMELPEPESEAIAPSLVEPPPAPAADGEGDSVPTIPLDADASAPRRMAPEELPPSAGWILDEEAGTMLPADSMGVAPFGGEAPAAVWSSGEWFRSGIWYTNFDFLVVRRSRPRDRLLIGIDITNPNRLFFNYGGTGGVEPGVRATIGRFIGRDWADRDHSVEATFLGIHEFRTGMGIRAQQEGGLILLLDQKQGGMNNADVWTSEHSSRFHSIETDLRLRHRPDKDRLVMAPDGTWTRQYTSSYIPSLVLGLRYLSLNEDYSFRSRSLGETFNQAGDLVPITDLEFRGDYDIETQNDLLGVQVGGDFFNQRERWFWGVRGKAGAFINFAEQFTVAQFNDLRAPGPGAPGDPSIDVASRVEEASRANEAFFGELSLMAAYHFTPNFTARASYDFMWLTGVALAPDQFTFGETARLTMDGVILYQGLSLGLEMVW